MPNTRFTLTLVAAASAIMGAQLLSPTANAADFKLSSPSIRAGQTMSMKQVFNGFGCKGDNVSPALSWTSPPAGTKSLALTVYDPDAPTGSGWWHWVVFNIPATATGLPEGAGDPHAKLTTGATVQGMTDYGEPGYGGPCPPIGDKPHRYVFTIHALKTDAIPVDDKAPAAMVGFLIHQNSLGEASLTATYGRKE
jgi:hypothetical protein